MVNLMKGLGTVAISNEAIEMYRTITTKILHRITKHWQSIIAANLSVKTTLKIRDCEIWAKTRTKQLSICAICKMRIINQGRWLTIAHHTHVLPQACAIRTHYTWYCINVPVHNVRDTAWSSKFRGQYLIHGSIFLVIRVVQHWNSLPQRAVMPLHSHRPKQRKQIKRSSWQRRRL